MMPVSRMPMVVAAAGLLFGCQTTSHEPAKVEQVREVSATVTAVDLPGRLVTLRGPEGKLFTVEAGEEVRNLPQVEVGDRVVVRYYEAIAAELAKPGQQAAASAEVTRAPLGAQRATGVPTGEEGAGLGAGISSAPIRSAARAVPLSRR